MAVSPVMSKQSTKADTNSSSGSYTGNSVNEITNNFMTLLVAQMKNQDPTKPMDNNQLTSQLAQLNTAAGVEKLNSTVAQVGLLVGSMQQMNAADWVGRTVLVEGEASVSTTENGNKEFGLSLNSDADEVTVTFKDSEGNAYTGVLKKVKAGVHKYSMEDLKDFKPVDPSTIKDKTFTVSFSAKNADGSVPEIISLKKAKVESVAFTQSGALLQLGKDGTAMLSSVFMVE